MGEFIVEVLFTGIIESLPKLIGAAFRWCFFMGKKPFHMILKEDWNRRVGCAIIAIIIGLLIW
ncbi:hypothetical protein HNV08_14825 [Winogradskyella eckloniae]|uniref:hypothetical protein n=1 Tax=Winogradskyella eckloniae TaxID=1089306 RepID=UPI00156723CF|nr:hypothetical protein [Winogradskyella eckloniae]NRD21329.1 hypothetical protein [Winogradskyella eckloniae]